MCLDFQREREKTTGQTGITNDILAKVVLDIEHQLNDMLTSFKDIEPLKHLLEKYSSHLQHSEYVIQPHEFSSSERTALQE